jgi:hypothetical protein
MAQEEYYSFEDVLKDLEIGEEELKRMVSEGELRAFRDENKMKFRRDDVESLRKGRTSEPTLILPVQQDEPAQDQAETILDLDAAPPLDEAGPALDLPGGDAGGADTQDVTKQLDFTDTDITVADEPVAVDTGADVEEGTMTEPLQLVEEGATEPVPTDEDAVAAGVGVAPRRGRRTIEITEADEEAIEARRPSWIWSIILLLSFGITAYSGIFLYELLRIQSGRTAKPSGLTEGLARKATDSIYADSERQAKLWSKTFPPNELPATISSKAVWQFTPEEMMEARKGIPIEQSMQGGAAPADAPADAPAAAPE